MDGESTWTSKDAAEILADLAALRESLLARQQRDDLAELRERKRRRAEELFAQFKELADETMAAYSRSEPPRTFLVVPSGPREFGTEHPAYEFVGIDPRTEL